MPRLGYKEWGRQEDWIQRAHMLQWKSEHAMTLYHVPNLDVHQGTVEAIIDHVKQGIIDEQGELVEDYQAAACRELTPRERAAQVYTMFRYDVLMEWEEGWSQLEEKKTSDEVCDICRTLVTERKAARIERLKLADKDNEVKKKANKEARAL